MFNLPFLGRENAHHAIRYYDIPREEGTAARQGRHHCSAGRATSLPEPHEGCLRVRILLVASCTPCILCCIHISCTFHYGVAVNTRMRNADKAMMSAGMKTMPSRCRRPTMMSSRTRYLFCDTPLWTREFIGCRPTPTRKRCVEGGGAAVLHSHTAELL